MRKFIRAEVFPEAAARIRRCIVDPYAEYLDKRLQDGCRSPTRLWRELCSQGFRGKKNSVLSWLLRRRGHQQQKQTAPRRPAVRVSSRQVVWSVLKSTSAAQGYLNELYRIAPEISILAQLARSFFYIVRSRGIGALTTWIASARDSALHGFASRLERDKQAVEAALQLPWSNGHVEGQVHRLKVTVTAQSGVENLALQCPFDGCYPSNFEGSAFTVLVPQEVAIRQYQLYVAGSLNGKLVV